MPACLIALFSRLFSPKNRRAMRLALTATVSVVDVGSDVYSVSINYRAGRTGLASGLLSTVLLSILLQTVTVCVAHRHHGKLVLTAEILLVLSGLKPFIDVWRMVHGHLNVGAPMDVQAERTACKVTTQPCDACDALSDSTPPRRARLSRWCASPSPARSS